MLVNIPIAIKDEVEAYLIKDRIVGVLFQVVLFHLILSGYYLTELLINHLSSHF